jgi:hypothetical protein
MINTIITIDGVDYDLDGFKKYLGNLHPAVRAMLIKDILKHLAENYPEAHKLVQGMFNN